MLITDSYNNFAAASLYSFTPHIPVNFAAHARTHAHTPLIRERSTDLNAELVRRGSCSCTRHVTGDPDLAPLCVCVCVRVCTHTEEQVQGHDDVSCTREVYI